MRTDALLSAISLSVLLTACGGGGGGSSTSNTAPTVDVLTENTISEDNTLTLQVTASDADNDPLSYALYQQATHGVALLSSGSQFLYTPEANYNGNDSFKIVVRAGEHEVIRTINIAIKAVNDAPVFNTQTQTFSGRDNQTLTGTLSATDAEDDTLTFSLVSGQSLPTDVEFNINSDGTFTYQNNGSNSAQVTLQVKVTDGVADTQTGLSFTTQTDPLLTQQWHLKNTGQSAFSASSGTTGHDINIGTLHIDGATGNGVKVAVVDSGLEIGHEDLSANILPGRSYDYLNGDTDPTPADNGGDHGTSVAGLIAAKGFNNIGGRGVAPNASLLGFNWLKAQTDANWQLSHGGGQTDDVQIINQSYGANISGPQNFFTVSNSAAESHLKNVTSTNNGGKGILMMKAAGNSFYEVATDMTIAGHAIGALVSEYAFNQTKPRLSAHIAGSEPESSSFYNTVISALNADAEDPLASYSSVGASVWVSAPGGEEGQLSPAMITADLSGCDRGYAQSNESGFDGNANSNNSNCNYTSTFNGTSSATPVASGVAALILEANSNLSWRDVRHIMAKTAKKIDADFTPIEITNGAETFVAEPGWLTNAAGYHFHNWYGFGMVDATSAVAMAKSPSYIPMPAVSEITSDIIGNAGIIPEGNSGLTTTLAIFEDKTVEAVQVFISATHGRDADLAIELTSPAGTKSMVLQPRSLLVMDQDDNEYADFNQTLLLSNAFYGESSHGDWIVKVTDTNSGDFIFYGYDLNAEGFVRFTSPNNTSPASLDFIGLRIYGH